MTKKSFDLQKKVARLEQIEEQFQKPDFNLEDAVALHAEAMGIAKEIKDYLDEAQQTLEKIDIATLRREA